MQSPSDRGRVAPPPGGDGTQVRAWAASGAMALTGRPDRAPLGPPRGLVPKLAAVSSVFSGAAGGLGGGPGARFDVDPLALLGERAALAGLGRQGTRSCGGGTRLLRAADGWVAVSLARPDDIELVPAWLGGTVGGSDVWATVEAAVAPARREVLVARARLLGLPVSALPSRPAEFRSSPSPFASLPLGATALPGPPAPPGAHRPIRVVDLGSLWAGPLCGSLLALAGAEVVKVESSARPDGARRGPAAFFDLMNGGKRGLAVDLRSADGIAALRAVIGDADVVIEASRPRALAQMGIDAEAMVSGGGPRVWVSITGYGRTGAGREGVAFGDDAAVAGGLVAWDDEGPCFCADAIADPASGLVAAAGVVQALTVGGRWLLDVAMADVAAHLAGPTLPAPPGTVAAPPRARRPGRRGPRLGEDTAGVLARLGGRR